MCLLSFGTPEERDSNRLNATVRGTVAADGSTEANHTICH